MLYLKNINIYTKILVIFTGILFFLFSCTPIDKLNTIKTNNKDILESKENKNNNFKTNFQYIQVYDDKTDKIDKINEKIENTFNKINLNSFNTKANGKDLQSSMIEIEGRRAFYISNLKNNSSYEIDLTSDKSFFYSIYTKTGKSNWKLVSTHLKNSIQDASKIKFNYKKTIQNSLSSNDSLVIIESTINDSKVYTTKADTYYGPPAPTKFNGKVIEVDGTKRGWFFPIKTRREK